MDHGKTSTISIFKTFIGHFYGYRKVITKTIWMRVKLANVHWTIFQIYQIQLRSEEKKWNVKLSIFCARKVKLLPQVPMSFYILSQWFPVTISLNFPHTRQYLISADLHSAANGNIEIDILTHGSYLPARRQQRCRENMPIMSSSGV